MSWREKVADQPYAWQHLGSMGLCGAQTLAVRIAAFDRRRICKRRCLLQLCTVKYFRES